MTLVLTYILFGMAVPQVLQTGDERESFRDAPIIPNVEAKLYRKISKKPFPLRISFRITGSLAMEPLEEPFLYGPRYKLVWRVGKKATAVGDIRRLAGSVRIESASAALNFARMTTSPALQLTDNVYEIVSESTVTPDWLYGCGKMDTPFILMGGGLFGVIPEMFAAKVKPTAPKVRWQNDQWTIERDAVMFTYLEDYVIVRLKETVSPRGDYYRTIETSPYPERFDRVHFWLPSIE